MAGRSAKKDHMDYAYDLDIAIKPTVEVPGLGKPYGYYTGSGNILFSVGWGIVRSVLGDVLTRFHARRGYKIVETPILARTTLYKISGHLDYYRDNMYIFNVRSEGGEGEIEEFALKPMNCPYHILILLNLLEKYRGKVRFPFKIFELGKVHRYELSGTLRGLLRVRGFTQDDAHIFTPKGEAVNIIMSVFEELKELYEKLFHIKVNESSIKLRLSFSKHEEIGREFMGSREEWIEAEEIITKAAEEIKSKYNIDYYIEPGEAAFYGPKIDVVALVEGEEKEWQIGTMQFDFNLPRRFKLEYYIKEALGKEMEIYMVHRALLGSLERFTGVYLELFKGRLPFILAPVQVVVMPIETGTRADERIEEVSSRVDAVLEEMGLRVATVKTSRTAIGGAIRRLETTFKPPLVVLIGSEEIEKKELSLRIYDYDERRPRNVKVGLDEDFTSLIEIIEKLEKPVVELVGSPPRLPVRLDYVS
jgi:threonyl-tRNA synthetase